MNDLAHLHGLLADTFKAGPAHEESIHVAERTLGIQFPTSYRAFLAEFGAVMGYGFEVAGLCTRVDENEGPNWQDIVTTTLQFRRSGRFPVEYLPISSDGGDFMYYLDTSQRDASGECPVIVLGPGADGIVIAKDFFEFVDRLVNGTIAW